jgi:Putative beta-barrel porin 2
MKLPGPFGIFTALIFGAFAAHAQELEPALPGRLTLFRPLTGVYEGFVTDFPLRTSVSTSIGYDDNVLTSHDHRIGSGYDYAGLEIASRIGAERTRLTGDLQLGLIGYWNRPGRVIDPDILFDLTFSHHFTPRLVIGFSSFSTYQAQPDFILGVGRVNTSGIYLFTSNSLALGYQWTPRFATATSYTLNALYYQNSTAGTTQNRLEHIVGQQFRFLVLPTITAVAEYRFGYEQYLSTNLDSYSHFVLGGADLMLSPRFQCNFRAGIEIRNNLFNGGGTQIYPDFESTLTYAYHPASYIQWYNHFGLQQSDIDTANSEKIYETGLRVLHSFGGKFKLGGGIYYSYKNYPQGPSSDENDLDASITASYLITRSFSLQAGYTFTRVFSGINLQDYYRNRTFLGASYSF